MNEKHARSAVYLRMDATARFIEFGVINLSVMVEVNPGGQVHAWI